MSSRISVKVLEWRDLVAGVRAFRLGPTNDFQLPDYRAGAHIDVHLPDGIVRQYSLCVAPSGNFYEIAVLLERNSRGGSAGMHTLNVGASLEISEPRNLFPLADGAQKPLLIAGGIGITPIKAMAHELTSRGADYSIRYFGKTRAGLAYLPELTATCDHRLKLFLDDEGSSLQDLQGDMDLSLHDRIYVCGPEGFIAATVKMACESGYPSEMVSYEKFSTSKVPSQNEGSSFTVIAARSGITVTVSSEQTVAQALQENGVSVSLSCEMGLCGTCVTRVLEGEPDHKDEVLDHDAKDASQFMTICCSRSKLPKLVLDI